MQDEKTAAADRWPLSADDDHSIDHIVKHYGVTREQARQLIKEHGASRLDLEAAAGRLMAKRVL
jgi:hypothetical protein